MRKIEKKRKILGYDFLTKILKDFRKIKDKSQVFDEEL